MRRMPKTEAKLDPVYDKDADKALEAAEKIVGAKMTDPTEDEEKNKKKKWKNDKQQNLEDEPKSRGWK